ncbi:hypothetical protein [Arenimonas daejeonensis]|uniref:aspartate-alanine antiporter-like transporter n=1 Tax=Arenimonas daejeonensis TaxID=370777 RepID=UPI001D136DB8|nr:hypothetical protein [Arenimonas daejeonensis]
MNSWGNPYILLFFTVGMAVWVGKFSVKGYGLGMVAAAVVVGAAIATWASTYGVKLQLDNFAKSLFYYLFMYGVGLRVGPAFFNSLKKDGITFTILAVICAGMGLFLVVFMSGILDLPAGAAGGVLAGSQTMSAAIGTAEMAVEQGAYKIPEGSTPESISAMIALGYGVTYIWGTVGIILVCKYLPRWWGIDATAAAKQYEAEHGVKNVDDAGITGYRAASLRAYRLESAAVAGKSIHDFRQSYPQYRIVNVVRGDETLGADPATVLRQGDLIALGGRLEELTANMGLIGPEVPDAKVLNIPLDQAEILGAREGGRRQGPEELRQGRLRRPAADQPDRTCRRTDSAGFRDHPEALRRGLCRRPEGHDRQGGRQTGPDCPSQHLDRPADAVGRHGPWPADRQDQRAGR